MRTQLCTTVLALLLLSSCTVNPATGARQLSLISEQQEIAMGQENDQAVQAQMGLYPNEELQEYVAGLGRTLAASSERPELPWAFRVIDDPTVNAFALPGGYIYVTRGILAHFNSEAELISVLGHEIGHVTARHSVEQISRSQLAGLGLGIAMIAKPELAEWGGLAQAGLGLMFLKFGRDDERESDDLGLRYLTKTGYDPNQMPKVFRTLDRVVTAAGGARIPAWASTHPNPENRAERIEEQISQLPAPARSGTVNAESYVRRLEGVVFGNDPRQGYFLENHFYHPGLEFQMVFPSSWKTQNQTSAVVGVSGEQDAIVVLALAKEATIESADRAFFEKNKLQRGRSLQRNYHYFATTETERKLMGIAGFVAHGDVVLQLLAYTTEDRWSNYRDTLRQSILSFGALQDRKYLDVDSAKIDIVPLDREMTLEQFNNRHPSSIDLTALAIINGVEPTAPLPRGTLVKRVVGGELPAGHE